MKATMTETLTGFEVSYRKGDTIEGELAARFVKAGVAVPIVEPEPKVEKATAPKAKVEKRTK